MAGWEASAQGAPDPFFPEGRRTWGEAAWTARDLDVAYIVTNAYGDVFGEFESEADAVVRREEIGAVGIECWVVPIQRGSLIEEEFTC